MKPTELARELDIEFRSSCARLNHNDPWFGHFTLRVGDAVKPYKVGAQRVPDERILDWRHPLARAYYEHSPGDEFELDQRGFAKLAGVVDVLSTLTTQQRTVRRVKLRSREGAVELIANDNGFEPPQPEQRHAGPTHAEGLPDVLALLTPSQYRLITASRHNPVIIQGRAGSGKTTVALYRVAWLTYADEESGEAPVDPARVLIVMFNRALSRFVEQGLAPLKLRAATLDTFHGWALAEIRRSYRGTIEPDTSNRSGKEAAAALKKQLGMLSALEAFVARQTASLERWLAEKLEPYGADTWLRLYGELTGPVVRRLISLRARSLSERDAAQGVNRERLTQVHIIFETAIRRMTQYKEELLRLLTDSNFLGAHLPNASPADLKSLAKYQSALQGEGGSERRPGAKVSFDDFALLLRLIQLKHGGFPDKARDEELRIYDHLVIDEAQDFGAVELTVLLSSVRSRTGVTIVGDMNQKILPDADFIGWDALATELGVSGAQVTKLEVVHRSTAPIMQLADSILGESNPLGRPGSTPTLAITLNDEETLDHIAELAKSAYHDNPQGHICIVCRKAATATHLHETLVQRLAKVDVPVRHGHNKHFDFGAGITVSSSRQVKGLEFDTVIVVNPTQRDYPSDPDGRRALYMVVTRAKEHLHFVSNGQPSKLLAPALKGELIELSHGTSIPPVQLTAEDQEPF